MLYLIKNKRFKIEKGRFVGLTITSKRGRSTKKTRYISENIYYDYLKRVV